MVFINQLFYLNVGFVKTFGYLLVFLATFLESSPFIGLFVPGSVVSFFGGFIARLGFLNFWLVWGLSAVGAILGDMGGYFFGRYFGVEFLHKYGKYFLIKKEYIERSCEILHSNIGKALTIGRVLPLTRSAAPFIFGARRTSFSKFMFFNAIGAISWSFVFVSLGYIFGHSYKVAGRVEQGLLVAGVVILILVYALIFLKRLIKKRQFKNCVVPNGINSKK